MISFKNASLYKIASLGLMAGLFSTAASAQDAKSLWEKSLTESGCPKMQDACQAAKLDPKKKDYVDGCNSFKTSINRSDESMRVMAIKQINDGDFAKATRTVNLLVCSTELKQSLTAQITDAQKGSAPVQVAQQPKADASPAALAETRTAYQEGHFDAALASAPKVTDSNLKPIADDIVARINNYRAAENAARQAEANKDYAGALGSWRTAQGIDANGPDSPGSNIARLEPLAHPATPVQQTPVTPVQQAPVQVAKNNPPPTNNPKQPPPPPVDTGAQVAKLMDDASKAEQANNLQAAVRSYDAVLRIQPNNTQATFNKAALLAKINSDPAEQAKSLAQAIRDFYASKYDEAEDGLRAYLDAPTAKSKGAAYFYMGATRLYSKVLKNGGQKADAVIATSDVQRPFKDARAAGYQPVGRFVSPLLMRAWQSAQ